MLHLTRSHNPFLTSVVNRGRNLVWAHLNELDGFLNEMTVASELEVATLMPHTSAPLSIYCNTFNRKMKVISHTHMLHVLAYIQPSSLTNVI